MTDDSAFVVNCAGLKVSFFFIAGLFFFSLRQLLPAGRVRLPKKKKISMKKKSLVTVES